MKQTGMKVALLIVAALSIAGTKVVKQPAYWSYNGVDYNTEAQCVAVLEALTVDDEIRICHKLERTFVYGDCSDVPRPAFTPAQLPPELCPDGSNYRISETAQVAAAFKACWAVVAVVKTECPTVP